MSSLVLGCIIINLNFGKCADGIYPKPKIKHIYEYPTELLLRLWYVNDLAIYRLMLSQPYIAPCECAWQQTAWVSHMQVGLWIIHVYLASGVSWNLCT